MTRILVVAPHPDDDVLGCGAMLARAFARGAAVRIVYVTDGAASHPSSQRFDGARLRALREAEAARAVRRLGGKRTMLHFLRVADGTLEGLAGSERAAVAQAVRAIVDAWQPDTIFAPWRRDPHPDHIAVSAIVREIAATAAPSPRLLEYPVWLPIRGTATDAPAREEVRRIDFRAREDERRRKRYALLAHRSQTTGLIDDDPSGFVMSAELIERFCAARELFYEEVA